MEVDNYERLRRIMNAGVAIKLPKHTASTEMLRSIFSEEEAALLCVFEKPQQPLSAEQISQLSGVPKERVAQIFDDMAYKGKVIKAGDLYAVMPFVPGLFEVYFTHNRDDPERMRRAAKAFRELFYSGHPFELSAGGYPLYRVIPAADPTVKTIEINRSLGVERQVLPYEVLEEYLSKADLFAVVPCSCRNAAKLAGEPCKRTDENFCVTSGFLAKSVIDQGVGRQVTLEELMDIMRRAEKAGLVHETINIQDTSAFICNCCPCCCGFLKSVKELRNYGAITKSNFAPKIDKSLCTLCEKCMEICPMEAIYHHWPHSDDLSDDMMVIREDLCIGCGVCASNCPNEAITLEKVRDVVPVKTQAEMEQKIREKRIH
ncbi:MAG: ATP-binding protein [Candidatus Freyarchaeota archaeon]